ncbi:hypothetical protein CLV84_1753 [Neolewinella xylanilytica]|uniref:Type VI secretion system protein ImpJ n=1 Tax=Neolewinella xylanilytica TaxID=1514080 RepID=A0A2S6IB93_9BACT|nr:hypothetical protein [Neolewinella xylanilytica]PPK88781.1 hypothetical protein CLV84_1753 [Neolewinella xylanilytica]
MKTREFWPVNWVDGMKINKSHFQQQESNLHEQIALTQSAMLTDHQYGLLPSSANYGGLDLVVTPERVEVRRCLAITRAGYLLVVGPENNAELQRRMSDLMYGRDFSEADTWHVVLRIQPGERIGIGSPAPEEVPLRQPFAAAKVHLEIVPAIDLVRADNMTHGLTLARIIKTYQGIERDRDFIPPVVRVNVSEQLLHHHHQWKEQLLATEGDNFEIIRKIKDKHRNNQGNQLSADLLSLSHACIRYINEHFDTYRLVLPQGEPILLFNWFMALARTIRNEVRLAGNQENMLNYLAHFIDGVAATDLMRFCNDLCDCDYQHSDIHHLVTQVNKFMGFVSRLFSQIRQLDYHEIATPTIINNRSYGRMDNSNAAQPIRPTVRPAGASLRITTRNHPRDSSQDNHAGDSDGWGLK